MLRLIIISKKVKKRSQSRAPNDIMYNVLFVRFLDITVVPRYDGFDRDGFQFILIFNKI